MPPVYDQHALAELDEEMHAWFNIGFVNLCLYLERIAEFELWCERHGRP